MTLENIESLLSTLILILPGFVLIKIHDQLMGRTPFRDNFEFTIWSAFFSLTIYFCSIGLNNIFIISKNYDNFLISLLIMSIIFLIVYIIVDKYELIDKIRKDILSNKKSYPDNSVWDRIIPEYSGYAIVHTSDGIKYCGRILFHTKGLGKDGKANKEMFLHEPVILNENMEPNEIEFDLKGVLLLENTITRIEFMDEINGQSDIEYLP